jgi:serine/threonine protein kinase/tetratricopeptide (TPR) repeat protein
MGVVYEARDERLQRSVAIKTILPAANPVMRDRFLREARAAAAVSHPHICQLFEIGEHDGDPFLAMELLEGEPLSARLERGPVPLQEAITITLGVLSALEALHLRGIVHRDLKPSNVFLTQHGVKLLDFGLARPAALDVDTTSLTLPGVLLGTPRYMAPEQARGLDVDARADIFATGAVLFEMLSGRPAFGGDNPVDVLHAVMNAQPPALVGAIAVVDVDRVIHRALAKSPSDRYQATTEMAADLRACLSRSDVATAPVARAATRLVVLPFKILRPDPSIDFLAESLPDAITISLSGLESLVVRSSLTGSRFGSVSADLATVAREANVDAVVTGSLLHASGQVRVSVQLVEAPGGTVLWSHAQQVPLDDLFGIQDSICSAVVQALALPLSSREQRLLRLDVPTNSRAYARYLRANQLSASSAHWGEARDLYRQAVEADPTYAPAWARLGRCLRVMGKYGEGADAQQYRAEAEDAFKRAFELNPDSSLAHNLYTYAEVETGRALRAVIRLLGRVKERSSDPELYAGLVHACRYVGLIDASVAACGRAKRLDPGVRTSVAHSYFMNGEFAKAIEHDVDELPYVTTLALMSLGRADEALAICRSLKRSPFPVVHFTLILDTIVAGIEKRHDEGREAVAQLAGNPRFSDPEGFYYWAQGAALLGEFDMALDLLSRAVEGGLHCVRGLETAALFDSLRAIPRFGEVLERARAGHVTAARAFTEADGHRLLGLPQS